MDQGNMLGAAIWPDTEGLEIGRNVGEVEYNKAAVLFYVLKNNSCHQLSETFLQCQQIKSVPIFFSSVVPWNVLQHKNVSVSSAKAHSLLFQLWNLSIWRYTKMDCYWTLFRFHTTIPLELTASISAYVNWEKFPNWKAFIKII